MAQLEAKLRALDGWGDATTISRIRTALGGGGSVWMTDEVDNVLVGIVTMGGDVGTAAAFSRMIGGRG